MARPNVLTTKDREKYKAAYKELFKAQQAHKIATAKLEEVCAEIRASDTYQMSPTDSWDEHGRIDYKSEPIPNEQANHEISKQ